MSRTGLIALFSICLVLGLADLGLLNFYLAPKAWPPQPSVAIAATETPATPQSRIRTEPLEQQTPTPARPATAEPAPPKPEPAPAEPAEPAPPKPEPPKPEPPKPEPAPAEPAEPAPPKPEPAHLLSGKIIIKFPTNKYSLNRAARRQLGQLLAFLEKSPRSAVIIEGHSDQRGREKANQTLSHRRARIVAHFLTKRGIRYKRIVIRGFGSSNLLDPGDTPTAWSRNRRVEITIKKREP